MKKRGRYSRPPQVRSVAWVSACSSNYRPQATPDSVDNGSPPSVAGGTRTASRILAGFLDGEQEPYIAAMPTTSWSYRAAVRLGTALAPALGRFDSKLRRGDDGVVASS